VDISVSQEQSRVPVTVFRIKGAITSAEELEQHAKQAYDAGTTNLLLDLTDVPYIATSGLRALHNIYTMLRTDTASESDEAVRVGIASGTFVSPHLKLLKPSKDVMKALTVTGYDMFLEIHTDRARALASF